MLPRALSRHIQKGAGGFLHLRGAAPLHKPQAAQGIAESWQHNAFEELVARKLIEEGDIFPPSITGWATFSTVWFFSDWLSYREGLKLMCSLGLHHRDE